MKYRIKAIKNYLGQVVDDEYNDSYIICEFKLSDGTYSTTTDDINIAYKELADLRDFCKLGEYYVAEIKE